MKVVHVYKDYPPVLGGIEHHLRLLAEGQARRGLEVTVLVTSRDRATSVGEENGVRVIRAARLAELASTPLSLELIRQLRRLAAEVAHFHFPYPLGETAELLSGASRARIVTYHSDIVRQRWLGRLYRPLLDRFLARADRILPTSPAVLESSPVLQRFASKCSVVPLGIDTARFAAPAPGAAEVQRRFPGPRVLFVGRLRYYKGVDVLIDAMAGLEATLLVVGRGAMEEAWREHAARSEAAARIHFVGDVSETELPAYYQAADLFVLPATVRAEAFGLAQVEAMAAATPVISTDLGTGTSIVNRHGETGWVVAPQDPAALHRAMARLVENPEERHALGRRAQARAQKEFGREQMLDRIQDVYETIIDQQTLSSERNA